MEKKIQDDPSNADASNGESEIKEMAANPDPSRINGIAPSDVAISVEAAELSYRPSSSDDRAGRLAKVIFFFHLLFVAFLIAFLALRSFLEITAFHPLHCYLPLLAATTFSSLAALLFLLLALCRPLTALKSSLWLAPFLACAAGVVLLATGTALGLGLSVLAFVAAISLALYSCSIASRLDHASRLLSAAVKSSPDITRFVTFGIVASVFYAWFWALGAGGLAAKPSRLAGVYAAALLLSLAWTMHVIKNTMHVAISRMAYMQLANGIEVNARQAFAEAATKSLAGICLGSAVEPVVGVFRGLGRAMEVVAGGSDEFLFSCARCWKGVASGMVARVNQWGFVRIGVKKEGFVAASRCAWEVFVKQGMVAAIEKDLTRAFCFLCGIAGGGMAALVAGSWVLAVGESYAAGVTVCAFFTGYFTGQIGFAWPQACVMAYQVAYGENPQNQNLGSAMSDWMRALESSPGRGFRPST